MTATIWLAPGGARAVAPGDELMAESGLRATLEEERRVEERIPRAVAYAHGLAALSVAALVVVLLVVD